MDNQMVPTATKVIGISPKTIPNMPPSNHFGDDFTRRVRESVGFFLCLTNLGAECFVDTYLFLPLGDEPYALNIWCIYPAAPNYSCELRTLDEQSVYYTLGEKHLKLETG